MLYLGPIIYPILEIYLYSKTCVAEKNKLENRGKSCYYTLLTCELPLGTAKPTQQ